MDGWSTEYSFYLFFSFCSAADAESFPFALVFYVICYVKLQGFFLFLLILLFYVVLL